MVGVKFRHEIETILKESRERVFEVWYCYYEGFAYTPPERVKIKEIRDPELEKHYDGCYEIVALTVSDALRALDYLVTIHKRRKADGMLYVEFKIRELGRGLGPKFKEQTWNEAEFLELESY